MSRARRVCYVTGTRADFGLMRSTLQQIQRQEGLNLAIAVTGMHLSMQHGDTVHEIVEAGLPVSAKVPVPLQKLSGAEMARNIGAMLTGFVDAFESISPDVVLLLGDRGEMLAGALAAIHLNIPVAHIHGGERSGTVDEPLRHAISKLSHLHFVATEAAKTRLVRMGELEASVFVTGAPGLDGLTQAADVSREALCAEFDLDPGRGLALFVFHPVLQEAERAGDDARAILNMLFAEGFQIVALMPNSDAGSQAVRDELTRWAEQPGMRILTHLPRNRFISWMAACDVMVGNSSSGIIEAGTFGTPVVNVGIRQNRRERNDNVIDTDNDPESIALAIRTASAHGRYPCANRYGDGRAGQRITAYLREFPFAPELLLKSNAY